MQLRHVLVRLYMCQEIFALKGPAAASEGIAEQYFAVPIRVTILYEFASYSSHKADDDFHYCCGALRAGYGPFMSSDSGISLMVVLC
jgi:hypothetical protein